MRLQLCVVLIIGCLSLSTGNVLGASLAPDDPSIVDGLVSWHRNAATNFSDGVWKANVGPDLVTLGEAEDGTDEFESPEAATWTPEEGYFSGLVDVNGVMFLADQSDMLWAEGLLGGDQFETLTLIGVYQTLGNTDRTRPVGIGSWTESQGKNNFNLSSDASLRYDNGNNQTDPGLHLPDLTYRAGILSDGLVSDFLDGEAITEEEFPGGSFEGITRNDNLFVGDVRGGLIDGFTGAAPEDVFVAEVIVYNSVLTEEQVGGIGEWLRENLTGAGTDPCDFDADGVLGLGDIDLLRNEIMAGTNTARFDVNGDGVVNFPDLIQLVESPQKMNTYIGDSNLDGQFNSTDFVVVFSASQYEDTTPGNSTWATGDWNGDGDFNSSDFVAAFTSGGYELGPRPAPVPEPSTGLLLVIGIGCVWCRRRF
ncbi:MAG: PEP-CTERM sorting domain-containing protein [Planctomycetales bacterium]|nr:PEP-CTERM sorting domain-containing protein [Planctomycetales bacterium]